MSCCCNNIEYGLPCCCPQVVGTTTTTSSTTCEGAEPCDVIYMSDCIIYTGSGDDCYGIQSGMDMTEVLDILIALVPQCTTTTTTSTTTTTTSTTTTTTTVPPTTTTTTSTTTTTTSTTTTTTTLCPCRQIEVSISQLDLDDATGNTDPGNNNAIVLTYRNCDGTFTSYPTSVAGIFQPAGVCTTDQSEIIALTYLKNNAPIVSTLSTATVTDTCC